MMADTQAPSAVRERIRELCREFRLPTLASETVSRFSEAGHADALPVLVEIMEQEAEDRRIRRVDRLRRASKLLAGKTWGTFEHERAPVKLRQQLIGLAEGGFVDRGVNVLAFGLPGTGKTHAMCAIGHRLVESGRSVLFIPAYRLVQDMLAAKRDLELPRMLRKLDNFDLLVIDDLGYLPQGAEESEVLFTLIAERYERRSLGITSNRCYTSTILAGYATIIFAGLTPPLSDDSAPHRSCSSVRRTPISQSGGQSCLSPPRSPLGCRTPSPTH